MTKQVILNTGEAVLVDDEDYAVISRYSWRKVGQKGYAGTSIIFDDGKQHTMYLHHLILGTTVQVDHENTNHYDNRKENLRPATDQQNGWNKGKPRAGRYGAPASQYKGVLRCIAKDGMVYYRIQFRLTKKGERPIKHFRDGPFATEVEAARAYNREIVKYRGKWAWLNPIPDEGNHEKSAA